MRKIEEDKVCIFEVVVARDLVGSKATSRIDESKKVYRRD